MRGALRTILLSTAAVAAVVGIAAKPVRAEAARPTVVSFEDAVAQPAVTLPNALAKIVAWSIGTGDIDGDGLEETVLAGGARQRPIVAVLRADGTLVRTFDVYSTGFTGGLNVAVGDIDGDGVAEIVTAPAGRGGPDVRVFSGRGELLTHFFAFATEFRGGVRLAVADVTGDGVNDIVAAAGPSGGPQVRVFNGAGTFTGFQWFAGSPSHRGGVQIASADFDGDGVAEIATAIGSHPATVTVRAVDGSVLSEFTAFPADINAGARLGAFDADGDGTAEIVVTPESNRRILRALNLDGSIRRKLTPPASGAGVVPPTNGTGTRLTVVTNEAPVTGRTDLPKYILVDISEQRLRLFEAGVEISIRPVSTGKWSMPTPLGTFQVRNKLPVAYSRAYNLYMDWWMAFTPNGAYGLHSLPYWKVAGGRLYEGEEHLGVRVSHGCIRQSLADAKSLFDWADIGTPVLVQP